ncbi:MAG TPA: hypothetical protein VNR39_11440 [Pseudolabrys sp.]|nr:hypothetical protein [Pseudolabrys sp.]
MGILKSHVELQQQKEAAEQRQNAAILEEWSRQARELAAEFKADATEIAGQVIDVAIHQNVVSLTKKNGKSIRVTCVGDHMYRVAIPSRQDHGFFTLDKSNEYDAPLSDMLDAVVDWLKVAN